MGISERYTAIQKEVYACTETAQRPHDDVRIVAVSKTVGVETIASAIAAGVEDFGENRPDALAEKQQVYPDATWHFIGNIQSRKIPEIVRCAQFIHSVYKPSHLPLIDAAAKECGKIQNILIEVNVSGEKSKGGLAPEELTGFIEACLSLSHIRVCGFMTMAPQGNLEQARCCFEALATLRKEIKSQFSGSIVNQDLHELSMGMSEDWAEAIAAGATMVRIGRAIFDESFA